MFARLSNIASRFRREERGNVLILTAFAVPAICLVTVGSLDMWEMMEQHRRMTVASEQAALAALRPERAGMSKRKKLAERMFLVNTEQGSKLGETRIKVRSWRSKNERFVRVTVNAKYKSVFGPIAGGKPKPMKTVTTAAKRGNVTRILNPKKIGIGRGAPR